MFSEATKEKIWAGNYWGPEGALAEAYVAFESSFPDDSSRIEYASTLYSAAGNARSQFLREPYKLHMGWRAYHCLKDAIELVAKLDLRFPNPNQCDVVSTILSKSNRHRARAELFAITGIMGINSGVDADPHTKPLLYLTLAEIKHKFGMTGEARENVEAVERMVDTLPENNQTMRVLRRLATLFELVYGDREASRIAEGYRRHAKEIGQQTGATDQLLKLEKC